MNTNKIISCLNPCFNGILKYNGDLRSSKFHILSLNPCFNGILKYAATILALCAAVSLSKSLF